MSSRMLGLGLAILGVLLLSPDAALTRLFDGASWTLIFWRTLGTFVVLGGLSLLWYRGGLLAYFRGLSPWSWLMLTMVSYGPLLWFWSVELAGGAQTLALLALSPLVAAFGGWLILGERLRWQMLLFGALALVGVIVTVWDGLATENVSLLGTALALFLPVNHSMIFVLSRKLDRPNAWPIFGLGNLLLVPIAFVLAPTIILEGEAQVWSIVPMVTVVATLSFALMILAARYVPASDVMLINMLEPVIGVIFLWLIVQELPTFLQWIGGGIVLVSVLGFIVWQLIEERGSTQSQQLSDDTAVSPEV